MPSDPRVAAALAAVAARIRAFQAVIASAADRVHGQLTAVSGPAREAQVSGGLGAFARGRIDPARFAAVADSRHALDAREAALLASARDLLRTAAARPPEAFVVDLPSGGGLSSALGQAFAQLGAPFGAVTAAELVRTQQYRPEEHSCLFHALPRHQWNRAERAVAPPLVVCVDGADLWAGELAQYADGAQKIVIIVRPPVAPAPLVRLISPGTWVEQTTEAAALPAAMTYAGPAIVVLLPEGSGAVEFAHRPDPRRPLHQRLTLSAAASGARRPLQGWTVWQQQEEWLQLQALAAVPAAPAAIPVPAATTDPTDQLARWLLAHADLSPAQT
jgi:hypothetical protein